MRSAAPAGGLGAYCDKITAPRLRNTLLAHGYGICAVRSRQGDSAGRIIAREPGAMALC